MKIGIASFLSVAVPFLLLASACSDGGESSVLDELARAVTIERGRPTLVFVYTDG